MLRAEAQATGQRLKLVPQRTCVACRRTRPQTELLRLTRLSSVTGGAWQVTAPHERRLDGRGRYLCADNPACWSEKRLRRSFGTSAAALAEQLATCTAQPFIPPAKDQPPIS